MANKKISQFPVTTSLAGNDAFLINHLGSTSTVAFSSLSSSITNDSIKLPSGATGGQVLTYNGSTTTWVASAVPKELPQTALSGQVLTYNGSTSTWVASAVTNPQNPSNAKAWVFFDGSRDSSGALNTSATNRFIYDSYNISSVLNTSQDGAYIISFITPMLNSIYPVIGTASIATNNTQLAFVVMHSNGTASVAPSATGFGIATGSPTTIFNCRYVSIMVF